MQISSMCHNITVANSLFVQTTIFFHHLQKRDGFLIQIWNHYRSSRGNPLGNTKLNQMRNLHNISF